MLAVLHEQPHCLLAPAFVASAAAPLAYAVVIDRFGMRGTLGLSLAAVLAALLAAVLLRLRFGRARMR